MNLDIDFWHHRYRQQVQWTDRVRQYIFQKIGAAGTDRILEVGCGSGALIEALHRDGYANATGLDLDLQSLVFQTNQSRRLQADAHYIPLSNQAFDLTICHFLLAWVAKPQAVLQEMKRITTKGGWLIALGEADYGGRIDYPPELEKIGVLQAKSLEAQGANPCMGRELRMLFTQSGLGNVQCGIIGAEWIGPEDANAIDLEWQVLQRDLADGLPAEELQTYQEIDQKAQRAGSRILYVPIFYALGQVI